LPINDWDYRLASGIRNHVPVTDQFIGLHKYVREFIIDLLSHQKALSRAEVLEEVRGKIEGKKREMTKKDQVGVGENLNNDTLIKLGYNKALSDTLAVVDELEGKK
jgi:hypothetical protein